MAYYIHRLMALVCVCLSMAHGAYAQEKKSDEYGFSETFSTLDLARWNVAHGWANGPHQSCELRNDAVSINNDRLVLTVSDRGGQVRPIGCPAISTKARLSYGRFEARMRAAAGSGLNTSLFSYIGPPNGVPEWDEIDFEILGKDPTKVEVNYVVNGKTIKGKIVDMGFDSSKDFHDYAFEWTRTSITWYIDGKVVYKTPEGAPMPRNAAPMILTVWSGAGSVDEWMGKFHYTKPITAEVLSAKYTPYE